MCRVSLCSITSVPFTHMQYLTVSLQSATSFSKVGTSCECRYDHCGTMLYVAASSAQIVFNMSGTTKTKHGRADPLYGELWKEWCTHVLDTGPTWLYVAVVLTHLLCCRITEVMMLSGSDFDLKHGTVRVKPLKRGKEMHKPMGNTAISICVCWKAEGVTVSRTRKQGARAATCMPDSWTWQDGWLFPADRTDSKLEHRNKDSVAKAICRIRLKFQPSEHLRHLVDTKRVRSHSGRHHAINDMKMSGVRKDVGKKMARIRDDVVWDMYGELSDLQVGTLLSDNVEFENCLRMMY